MAYLVDHPPTAAQFGRRTARPTGLTVVHTAESLLDAVGPDTGAENVADFIRRRTTYGSYHDLVDSDSAIQLVRYEDAAWQDGTGSNPYALSISFALSAADWPRLPAEKRDGFLRQGAVAFRRQQAWLRSKGYPTTPLRRISRAESSAGVPGFISHGERDPGRRTDPGAGFPWARFFELCATDNQGDDMTPHEAALLQAAHDNAAEARRMTGVLAAKLDEVLAAVRAGGGSAVDVRAVADQLTVVPKV